MLAALCLLHSVPSVSRARDDVHAMVFNEVGIVNLGSPELHTRGPDSALSLMAQGSNGAATRASLERQGLQVHVLAYKRPKSLSRLLRSLKDASYDGDPIDLHIHVDAPAQAADEEQVAQVRKVASVEQASWPFGTATVEEAREHRGLRDMWLQSWTPRSLSERALILEDDLEVSPQWYRWLKSAHSAYASSKNLAGISLQRLAWTPSGKPLDRLPGHSPLLSPTVGTWALSPSAEHWQGFQRHMHSRSLSASTIAKFSSLNADPGYALQAGWDSQDPKQAINLWSPAFASYCSSKGLLTLYPSLQPDYHALAVHWRESGTHYRRKEGADFVLAKDWLPGMSTLPTFESLARVPFNGFREAKAVNLLAADATQDALDAYKKLEEEASAKAGSGGGPDDSELFTDDAWEWDRDRARQLFEPTLGQLTLLCAAVVNLVLLAAGAVSRAVRRISASKSDGAKATDAKAGETDYQGVRYDAAKESDPLSARPVTAEDVLAQFYRVCLPCAELSFWLLWTTLAEFVFPSRPRTHTPGDFWELMLILGFVSILWQRPVKPAKGVASLLSRDLTSEWRGWMQAAFLMYHYCHMNEVYAYIRLLVSAYVWQTGFGNGMYFIARKEFTGERMFQMLWRLNFLVCLLVLATKTPWIAYYVCALHTVHFLMIFAAMWIACNFLWARKGGNDGGLAWWPWASLLGLSIFCVLVWDVPLVYEFSFGAVVSWAFGADFDRELHFRTFLDHYSSCFGLLAAIAAPTLEAWANRRPIPTYLTLGAVATALAAVWFACYWATKWDESDAAYDKIHPYISTLPLWLYVLVRGARPGWRNTVSVPLEFIGKHSLEFYLLQFHLFLSQEAGAILMLVPNKRLNIAIVMPIYVLAAMRLFHLTNVIKDIYFAMSNTFRLTVSLYLAFGALLAGAGASGGLPLWAMWLMGAVLVCIPPLGALAARASMPEEGRRSVKETVRPLLILAAIMVPSQLIVGSALLPAVRAGSLANIEADVPLLDDPSWTESVVDGRCTMVTVPANLIYSAKLADACADLDEHSFDGWRSAASEMITKGAQMRRLVESAQSKDASKGDEGLRLLRRESNATALESQKESAEAKKAEDAAAKAEAKARADAEKAGRSAFTFRSTAASDGAPAPEEGNGTVAHGHKKKHFVLFWGDSTVRFQFKLWVELLGTEHTELTDYSLRTMRANMSDACCDRPAPPDKTQLFVWHANGTLGGHEVEILYVGSGIFVDIELAPTVLSQMADAPYHFDLPKTATMAIVGSAALHHFHLEPVKEWEHPDKFQHLESRINAGLTGLQLLLPKTQLLYFTVHSMCDHLLLEDGWAETAKAYNAGRGECEGARCEDATFNRHGAVTYYQREMKVLRMKNHSSHWGVIDAFKMTDGQCWATADGRHFNPLLPQFTFAAFAQQFPSPSGIMLS